MLSVKLIRLNADLSDLDILLVPSFKLITRAELPSTNTDSGKGKGTNAEEEEEEEEEAEEEGFKNSLLKEVAMSRASSKCCR